MSARPTPRPPRVAAPARRRQPERRWLLLVHQLPSTPSNTRVRTWRRLQQLGAVAVKQAVYALPDSAAAREDFEWLKTEIEGAGGEASVFAADSVDAWTDDEVVEEFRRSRQEAYAALARELEQALQRATASRRRRGARAPAVRRLLEGFRQRFTAIEAVDFFGSAGRDRVVGLLEQLEERLSKTAQGPDAPQQGDTTDRDAYRRRLWVTRPRPGVDRMASAWLIRRFIDPDARFGFVSDRDAAPREAIPFDMFGVEFSHQGDHCTFETLCRRFAIQNAAAVHIAAIVHDLDLKDGRFGSAEAPAIGRVIEGLQLVYGEDDELLAHGTVLFEALYRAFGRSRRTAGPRPPAFASRRQGSPERNARRRLARTRARGRR